MYSASSASFSYSPLIVTSFRSFELSSSYGFFLFSLFLLSLFLLSPFFLSSFVFSFFPSPIFFLKFYPLRNFHSFLAIFPLALSRCFFSCSYPRFLLFSAPLGSFISLLSLTLYPPLCVSLSLFFLFSVASLSTSKIKSLHLFFVMSLCPSCRHLSVYSSLPLFVLHFSLCILSVSHSCS